MGGESLQIFWEDLVAKGLKFKYKIKSVIKSMFPYEHLHVFLSTIVFAIVLVYAVMWQFSLWIKSFVGTLTFILLILSIMIIKNWKQKNKKSVIHRLEEQEEEDQRNRGVSNFQHVCSKILMEKKLKKMEGNLDQHLTDRFYGTSLHDTKINYQYKTQEKSPGTSIFYSAESVLGDARKLTLENYNLPFTQF